MLALPLAPLSLTTTTSAPLPLPLTLPARHLSYIRDRRATMAASASASAPSLVAALPTASEIAEQLLASLKGAGASSSKDTGGAAMPATTPTRTRRALTSAAPRLETVYDEHPTSAEEAHGAIDSAVSAEVVPAPAASAEAAPTPETNSRSDAVVLLRVLTKQNCTGVATFEVCSNSTPVLKSLFTDATCPFRIVPVPSTPAQRSRDLSHCLNTRYLPAVEDTFLLTLSPARLAEVQHADPWGLGKRRVLVKPHAVAEFVRRKGFRLLGSHVEGYGQAGSIMDVHTFIRVNKGERRGRRAGKRGEK